MESRQMKMLTRCVHAGGFTDQASGGVTTPVFMSSSFRIPDGDGEICYPRYFNTPNHAGAAEKLAALENGEAALILGSGMAAITTTLFALLGQGDHAVIQSDVYGGTYHFIVSEMHRYGIEISLVRSDEPGGFESAVRETTRLILVETPTNPLLTVVNLNEVVNLARKNGLVTVVDNTFATPINQTPLDAGIDVVIHSGTKYLGGHSDMCCGAVVSRRELLDKIAHTAVNHGGVLPAFELYLLERSLATLGLRVAQHNCNAMAVAAFLSGHPKVKRVFYPGLPGHPGHETACAQMTGFGGMLSVDLACNHREARRIVKRFQLITHAVSLGGVESPGLFSRSDLPRENAGR